MPIYNRPKIVAHSTFSHDYALSSKHGILFKSGATSGRCSVCGQSVSVDDWLIPDKGTVIHQRCAYITT